MVAIDELVIKIIIWALYAIGIFFSLFWLYSLLLDPKPDKKKKVKKWPKVTVILPMYNEEKSVEKSIESVFSLDYPKNKLKVICVNDGSSDNTLSILEKLRKKYDFTIINQKNQGKFMALNNALKITDTPFFACLDADSYVQANSLKQLIKDFNDESVVAVMPIMKVYKPKNLLQRIQWFEYIINIFYKYIMGRMDCIHVTPGPFTVYRADIVKKLGGFKKGHLTEDLEMALRLQSNHYKIKQNVEAVVYTDAPETYKQFISQRVRWYGGTMYNVKDYKHLLFNPKYGDFGLFQMPLVALSGIFTLIGVIVFIYIFSKDTFFRIKRMYLTHFDFGTYIKSYHFNFSLLDMNWQVLFTSFVMFFVFFLIIYLSFEYVHERFSVFKNIKYLIMFILYIFGYNFLLAYVWFVVIIKIIFKRTTHWTK
ncbi:MAG: glycosyltransferase [Nitrospiraceae bacterium]|nr:glycosyltransferase [Nitrospiraceae bacterium]